MWTFSSGFDPLWREGISTRVWRILRRVEKEDLPDTAHSEIRNVGTTIHSTSVLSDKRICKVAATCSRLFTICAVVLLDSCARVIFQKRKIQG